MKRPDFYSNFLTNNQMKNKRKQANLPKSPAFQETPPMCFTLPLLHHHLDNFLPNHLLSQLLYLPFLVFPLPKASTHLLNQTAIPSFP